MEHKECTSLNRRGHQIILARRLTAKAEPAIKRPSPGILCEGLARQLH